MESVLEILKISIPALIVYLTVKSLFGNFLISLLNVERQKNVADLTKEKSNIRLQALERLVVFLERANPYQMRFRLEVPEMTGKQLATSMVIAINQEFEHNISQQLFVSEVLWKIIVSAKDQTLDVILRASGEIGAEDNPSVLMQKIDQYFASLAVLPLDRAKSAIKNEYDTTL